jgi:hypothetical protein
VYLGLEIKPLLRFYGEPTVLAHGCLEAGGLEGRVPWLQGRGVTVSAVKAFSLRKWVVGVEYSLYVLLSQSLTTASGNKTELKG